MEKILRTQYALGYPPPDLEVNGSFRTIEVISNKRGLQVHTRNGYFAPHKVACKQVLLHYSGNGRCGNSTEQQLYRSSAQACHSGGLDANLKQFEISTFFLGA